ncbi:MAG: von Willebrand factor type A domain-containing protein [candidate division Zixibacteria bacterium]|nr:von Willebrand factor type A domain-containing protein [candidate division Zixibacteria bacterium]
MNLKRFVPFLILTISLIVATIIVQAASTGIIKGTVTDSKTGESLFGVSVVIEGTNLGGKTDFDGNYLINNLPPGTYNLLFSSLGYEKVRMTDVVVTPDSITERNIQLRPTILETDKIIEVLGTRKGIHFNQTMSISIRKREDRKKEEILAAPCGTVKELLGRETGSTRHSRGKQRIRGGRSRETTYVVDGVNFTAPLGGPIPNPAHGGTNIVNDEAFDAMFFKNYGVNPFVDTEDDHLSTFASDVDDASFIMTRSYINRSELPPTEAVRVEEFVNHFNYNYKAPHEETFSVYIEGAPSQFGKNCSLLRIGIKGMEIPDHLRKPANLVFVIDVSGSMDMENRLGLVKRSLYELLDQLKSGDRVGIVVYGSTGQVVLQPTSIRHRTEIERAIDRLVSNGSTNAEEGIRLGYEMADRMFEKGKINRIILCSDGVANVGNSGPDAILKQIKKYAEKGITLSAIGFGMGNYNDVLMEQLGNKGNGHYAYIDDITEARRIFVENLTGNLQVIALDVKLQVDFNPEVVRSYRLLGYENRNVADDKFRDDKEDGGEVGAGHSVTALYEVKFTNHNAHGVVGTVYVRYKDPESFKVSEFNEDITHNDFTRRFYNSSPEFRLAAVSAEFAEILRASYWARDSKLSDLFQVAKVVNSELDSDESQELLNMIKSADSTQEAIAEK